MSLPRKVILKVELDAIMHKIGNALVPIAVFYTPDGLKTTKVSSALFINTYKMNPMRLLGCYTEDCIRKWLEEDIRYMGGEII